MTKNTEPTLSFFPVQKPGPECLSTRQIARIATGAIGREEFNTHLRTCAVCSERVTREIRACEQDVQREVPGALLRALREPEPEPKSRWSWFALVAPLSLATAVALLVVKGPNPEDAQPILKGGTAVLATVQRNGVVILKDRDAASLVDLQPGDQIRFEVVNPSPAVVIVQVQEGKQWKDYFRGEVPKDGWLPTAMEVTAGEKTPVRVSVCPQSDAALSSTTIPGNCFQVTVEL